MNPLYAAYLEELEKVAGPFTPYERMRRAAKRDRALSDDERAKMQKAYLEARGSDRGRAVREGLLGAASGAAAGAAGMGVGTGGRASPKALIAAALAGGALGGAATGAASEYDRRQAAQAAGNPSMVRADLAGAYTARRVNQASKLLRNREAARRGEKPSSAMFRLRSARSGDGKL